MAKPTVYEKAWERFSELYDAPAVTRGGGSRKQRTNRRKHKQAEQDAKVALLALATSEGIAVKPLSERERAQVRISVNGTVFFAGGLYYPFKRLIKVPEDTPLGTLIHELAHALDHSLGWSTSSSAHECVAIGVEYLLSASLLGYRQARPNLRYANKQGVSSAHVLAHRERIEFIHDYMLEFIHNYLAEVQTEIAA